MELSFGTIGSLNGLNVIDNRGKYQKRSFLKQGTIVDWLEAVWRRYWTIENRKHYVRDAMMGEDRNQMHCSDAPRVLATPQRLGRSVWKGWINIADAVRECAPRCNEPSC
jgi:hypothetical protein